MKLHLREANENENMLEIENGVLIRTDRELSGDVVIPNSVKEIEDNAFGWRNKITSVIIPNGVTSIGKRAFQECYSLSSVTIPNSVTSIENGTFQYCYKLSSITIPSSVTSIEGGAFLHCEALTSITIPNSVTSIDGSAFFRCNKLSSITIPNSVTKIGKEAFAFCENLKSVTMPERLLPMIDGLDVFKGCSNIKINGKPWSSWEFRNELFHIVDNVLYEVNLKKVPSNGVLEIPNGVKKIVHSALHFMDNWEPCIVQTLIIPSSVETLEEDSLNWACDPDSTYESAMIKNISVPKKLVRQLKQAGINYPCTVNGEPWPKRREPRETIVATYAVSYTDYSSGGTLIIKKKGRKFAWECDGAEESTDFEFNSEHEAYEDAINFLDPNQNSLYLDNQPVFDEENYNEYNEEDEDEE